MREQLKLDLPEIPCDYNCYQDGKEFHTNSKEDAWKWIMQSWGAYTVCDRNGSVRPEFIPF